VRDFDDQQHVLRFGRLRRVEVVARAQQREVGLRLGPVAQAHGVLHRDDRLRADRACQRVVQPVDCPGVQAADRRHLDDHSLDQLDTTVGRQHAGLDHPVVLLHRQPMTHDAEVSGKFVDHTKLHYGARGSIGGTSSRAAHRRSQPPEALRFLACGSE
jgi:hypothetical protein